MKKSWCFRWPRVQREPTAAWRGRWRVPTDVRCPHSGGGRLAVPRAAQSGGEGAVEAQAHLQGATVGRSLWSHHEGREPGPCKERGTLGWPASAVTAVLMHSRCRDGEREVGSLFRLRNPEWREARGRQRGAQRGEECHTQLWQSKDGVGCPWVCRRLSLEALEPRWGGRAVVAPSP